MQWLSVTQMLQPWLHQRTDRRTVAGMADRQEWVLLAYRMPWEPSSPRITVWRRLRKLGAVQVVDGLVALPADARTKEQLEWVADQAVEAGGEATVWLARLSSARQERELPARVAAEVADAYDGDRRGGRVAPRRRGRAATHSRASAPGAAWYRVNATTSHRPPVTRRSPRCNALAELGRGRDVKWATRTGCHVDRCACRVADPTIRRPPCRVRVRR